LSIELLLLRVRRQLARTRVSFEADGFNADGSPQISWIVNIVGNPPKLGALRFQDGPVVEIR
jgi:hypothetical protein